MNSDGYAAKQAARDAQYRRDYDAWISSLSPAERADMQRRGLLEPMLATHGCGSPDSDAAESPRASYCPDMATLTDHKPAASEPSLGAMQEATAMLQILLADIRTESNARLALDCLSVAFGLSAYDGESMTEIAARYSITRAAVSKRCVDITKKLGLPPSRAMRSLHARATYQSAQKKKKPTHGNASSYE
jgi:hypothetical protein